MGHSSPDNFTDYFEWYPNEKFLFLQHLIDNVDRVNNDILRKIDQDYNVSQNKNMEILWRWFKISVLADYTDQIEAIHQFLGEIGRMKMIRPIYQALAATGQRDLAIQYFEEYRPFYHPIAAIMIAHDLDIQIY